MTDNIQNCDIVDLTEQNYIDYAMAVITDRALPSVQDGLKPSQRIGLYTFRKEGAVSDKKLHKQPDLIGATLPIYDHGETSMKGALDRMSQPWILREPLIYTKGQIGLPDGHSNPAASRYLTSKLSIFGDLMTDLLNKNVVPMIRDDEESPVKPKVLPSLFPNILVNPQQGIAVGMAGTFLPHNLAESCDAVMAYLKNSEITTEELLEIMPGPDLPLGGTIINQSNLLSCYESGKGRVIMRGRPIIIKNEIIFREFPFNTNLGQILAATHKGMAAGAMPAIEEVDNTTGLDKATRKTRYEITFTLKRGADPQQALEQIYANTPLQSNVSFNMMAINSEGRPHLFTLKDILREYSEHLCNVHEKSLNYDLVKLEHKLMILSGYKKAMAKIDEVIAIIRNADNDVIAKNNLMKLLDVNAEQAIAILDLPLKRLTKLDVNKLQQDIEKLEQKIIEIKNHLENLADYVIASLGEIKKHSSPRRTDFDEIEIVAKSSAKAKIVIPNEPTMVNFNERTGVVKQVKARGLIKCSTLDQIYCFTRLGKVISIQAYELPFTDTQLEIVDAGDKIIGITTLKIGNTLFQVTQNGYIKGTKALEYINLTRKNSISIKLKETDEVIGVFNVEKTMPSSLKLNDIDIDTTKLTVTGRSTLGKQFVKDKIVKKVIIGR